MVRAAAVKVATINLFSRVEFLDNYGAKFIS